MLNFNEKKLNGVRVWISGAVPETEYWPHSLYDRDILQFIALFSRLVLKKGGTVIHGSHPSFTPVLANQLSKTAQPKSKLRLYVSEIWQDEVQNKYSESCEVNVTKKVVSPQGENDINQSLTKLRKEMALNSDVIVVLGGKMHANGERIPGIVEEIKIAQDNELRCYILPNFHGASQLFDTHSSALKIDLDEIDLDILGHKLVHKMEEIYKWHSYKANLVDLLNKLMRS